MGMEAPPVGVNKLRIFLKQEQQEAKMNNEGAVRSSMSGFRYPKDRHWTMGLFLSKEP